MADGQTLTLDTTVAQGESQVSTKIGETTMIMNAVSGRYFDLDDIGSRIWTLIETPTTIAAVCDRLVEEYDVERSTCEAEVTYVISRLLANDIARVAGVA